MVERMLAGDRRALARLISSIENGSEHTHRIVSAIEPHLGRARVLGVTGPPGVGKSTLVSAVVGALRRRERTVGVVAVDPSSPVTGGAILGDRVRMTSHVEDPGVFIRSVSARGHLGGLSAATADIVDLLDAAGFDTIVVETVGAGQSEVAIAEIANCKAVVLAPGLGDDVQAIKAGILEIADILVVNKADRPDAGRTSAVLKAMLKLRPDSAASVPVIETTATQASGVEALVDAVFERWARAATPARVAARQTRIERLLAGAAGVAARELILTAENEQLKPYARAVRDGTMSLEQAALSLTKALLEARDCDSNA